MMVMCNKNVMITSNNGLGNGDTEANVAPRHVTPVLHAAFLTTHTWKPTTAQVEAVRAALDRHEAQLDDAMLSNAFAWIRKCSEDRFDTMVQLIQKVWVMGWQGTTCTG
eukprot:scaffold99076_cov25-Tisochrysis_lutea.AAC.5